MPQLLRVCYVCGAAVCRSSLFPPFAQYPAPKPTSPGEMAAIDKDKAEKRAACQREARAQKLSYLKRRQFVRNCTRR